MRIASLSLILLCGCSADNDLPPEERKAAERWVNLDQTPLTVVHIALWRANGLPGGALCGEIAAPPALKEKRATLRYIYDASHKVPFGQVEKHELWQALGGASEAILHANRQIFDDLWAGSCLPYAPWRRRLAARTGIDLDGLGIVQQVPVQLTAEELDQDLAEREKRASENAERLRELVR